MSKVFSALIALEKIAPRRFAFSFDKVGLQVGEVSAPLTKGVVSLDRSLGAVKYAAENGAQMLVAHHPLIFEPISAVTDRTHVGRTILELARNNIAFAAAHTNWDSARGGINDALAKIFGLVDVKTFGSAAAVRQLKVVVLCPAQSAEAIIDAVSAAGAGLIGEYKRCAFVTQGTGTFHGSEASSPAVGEAGKTEHVAETRIEMVLPEAAAKDVEEAIRKVHPYEEPAVDFFALADRLEQPAGRVGRLPQPMTLRELTALANERLDTAAMTWGNPSRMVTGLAIVGGSADSEWREARSASANVLLTGEVKQHVGLEAVEQDFPIIAAGHFATEHPGCATLRDRLAEAMPDVEWLLYTPEPGFSGRPFHST